MTENQKAGNAQPWSEEQQEEYLRRYRLTAKKERIERVATNILHGKATYSGLSGCTVGDPALEAFKEAEALINLIDGLT